MSRHAWRMSRRHVTAQVTYRAQGLIDVTLDGPDGSTSRETDRLSEGSAGAGAGIYAPDDLTVVHAEDIHPRTLVDIEEWAGQPPV